MLFHQWPEYLIGLNSYWWDVHSGHHGIVLACTYYNLFAVGRVHLWTAWQRVTTGSPLNMVIVNFFMEKFEEVAIRPKYWNIYVNNTFVVWSHGEEELLRFLLYLEKCSPQIQFTIDKEAPSWVCWSWERAMVVLPSNCITSWHISACSNHHPRQKHAVVMMAHWLSSACM